MSTITAETLLACQLHCLRANYQAFIWRQAHIAYPTVPSPDGYGWVKDTDGSLRIDWIEGDMIPHMLLDILEDTNDEDGQTSTTFEVTEEDDEVDNIGPRTCTAVDDHRRARTSPLLR